MSICEVEFYKVVEVKLNFGWRNCNEIGFFTERIEDDFIEFIDLKGKRCEKFINSIDSLESREVKEEKKDLIDKLIMLYQAKAETESKCSKACIEYWDQNRVIDTEIRMIRRELQEREN